MFAGKSLSRRRFLKLSALAAAAAPFARVPWVEALAGADVWGRRVGASADLTTLDATIVRGRLLRQGTRGSYYRLTTGPGEPFITRTELAPASAAPVASAIAFVHFTDIHLIDAQSPARAEFLDRFADEQTCESFPLSSAHRPQETLQLQVLEAMVRRVRKLRGGPATGSPFSFVVWTGDNIDNELSANDYHYGFDGPGHGTPNDRNVELMIRKPF